MPTSPINDSCESIPVLSVGRTMDGNEIPMRGCSCHQHIENQDFDEVDDMPKKVRKCEKTKCIYIWLALNSVIIILGITAVFLYIQYGAGVCKESGNEDTKSTVTPSVTTRQKHYMLRLNYEGMYKTVIRWSCPKNGTSSFDCDDQHVTIPVTGWYILHLKLSVNTNLGGEKPSSPLIVHDCIVKHNLKSFRDVGHCVRAKRAPDWEGPSEIIVMRQYLKQGETIKATSLTDRTLIDPAQSMMEIALAEKEW